MEILVKVIIVFAFWIGMTMIIAITCEDWVDSAWSIFTMFNGVAAMVIAVAVGMSLLVMIIGLLLQSPAAAVVIFFLIAWLFFIRTSRKKEDLD